MKAARGNFEVLDGLRGVAALLVVLGHASALALGTYQFAPRSYLAVQFFFMLSGFVMAHAYDQRLQGGMSAWEFGLRRVIRLHPMILLSAVLGTGYLAVFDPAFRASPTGPLAVGLGALALPMPVAAGFSHSRWPINPPEWSLFYEFIGYALFATVLVRLGRRPLIALALCAFGVFAVTLAVPSLPDFVGDPAGMLASFTTGVLLRRNRSVLPKWSLGRLALVPLGAALVAVCFAPLSFGWPASVLAVAVVFPAVLLLGSADGPREAGPITRGLGHLSYPLYVLHWPVILFVLHLGLHGLRLPMIVSIGAAVVVSALAFWLYDAPVRAWLSETLLSRHKSIAA